MLRLPPSIRVFIARGTTDMRKGFDTLSALAKNQIGQDPFSGHLFVFFGKRGDRIKVLWWDRSGYALFYKRLEKGSFPGWNRDWSGAEISPSELTLLLDGVEVARCKRHRDHTPVGKGAANSPRHEKSCF